MKRNLVVPSTEKAIELMKAFLSSQLIEVDLDRDIEAESERTAPYFIKLTWLSRDFETDIWLGCPCFVSDFHGKLASGEDVHGVIYVKCFPTQSTRVTQMKIVDKRLDFGLVFIEDGEDFIMHDKLRRYDDEHFIFKDGKIEVFED
jgi:hypothetical protein